MSKWDWPSRPVGTTRWPFILPNLKCSKWSRILGAQKRRLFERKIWWSSSNPFCEMCTISPYMSYQQGKFLRLHETWRGGCNPQDAAGRENSKTFVNCSLGGARANGVQRVATYSYGCESPLGAVNLILSTHASTNVEWRVRRWIWTFFLDC